MNLKVMLNCQVSFVGTIIQTFIYSSMRHLKKEIAIKKTVTDRFVNLKLHR
jgi:hypothetical protein